MKKIITIWFIGFLLVLSISAFAAEYGTNEYGEYGYGISETTQSSTNSGGGGGSSVSSGAATVGEEVNSFLVDEAEIESDDVEQEEKNISTLVNVPQEFNNGLEIIRREESEANTGSLLTGAVVTDTLGEPRYWVSISLFLLVMVLALIIVWWHNKKKHIHINRRFLSKKISQKRKSE